MAGPAPKKAIVVCMVLVAIVSLYIGQLTTAQAQITNPTPKEDPCSEDSCVESKDNVPKDHACICSRNCACAGKCLKEGEKAVDCFINCVLKDGCVCGTHAGSGGQEPPGNSADSSSSPPLR